MLICYTANQCLPGERLISAFIATLGLPQINPINEEIKQRMEVMLGSNNGYDYTYLFPGLTAP